MLLPIDGKKPAKEVAPKEDRVKAPAQVSLGQHSLSCSLQLCL
jgi:hypothetical protein